MITNFSAITIREACAQFSIPVPKPVMAAEELHAAAVDLLTGIRAETVPDIETVTLKNMAEVHAQMVARTTWQTRERAALEIEGSTEGKRMYAWHQVAAEMCEAFRVPFDKAAGVFGTALKQLDGNTDAETAIGAGLHEQHRALTTAAADLKTLTAVRDALATSLPVDAGHQMLDKLGRIAHIPDMDTITRRIPIRSGGHPEHSLGWFVMLQEIPGVVIQWHTPSEQQTFRTIPARQKVA
jgi:hypothetical protein